MKTLVLASQQRGVGRSVAATLIARFIADRGLRVLALDLDPQGSFGRALRRSGAVAVVSLGEDALMSDGLPQLPRQRVVLVDGAGPLRGLDHDHELHGEALCNLQDLLSISNRWFDACVIDTPAGPDARQHAALASAGLLLVPIRLNYSALQRACATCSQMKAAGFNASRTPPIRICNRWGYCLPSRNPPRVTGRSSRSLPASRC